MAPGKENSPSLMHELHNAVTGSTGEIRVHLSRAPFERDPLKKACRLFETFAMQRTADRNAVLLYINTRSKRFAIVADEGLATRTGREYTDGLAKLFAEDLKKMAPLKAVVIAVHTLGATLRKHFPSESRRDQN